jgi:hypothetical protein
MRELRSPRSSRSFEGANRGSHPRATSLERGSRPRTRGAPRSPKTE